MRLVIYEHQLDKKLKQAKYEARLGRGVAQHAQLMGYDRPAANPPSQLVELEWIKEEIQFQKQRK